MISYKTEIDPTPLQKDKINKAMGTCRFVYNLYLSKNKEYYDLNEKMFSANEFKKWLNNVFIVESPEYAWIKESSTKSISKAVSNAENAIHRFLKGKSKYPKYKTKRKNDIHIYFVRNDKNYIVKCERHRIWVPKIGFIKIKEKGYLPTNGNIINGNVSKKAGRYYVSVTIESPLQNISQAEFASGIGIDLGIKTFATASNGHVFENINKTQRVKKINKRIKRCQRKLSKKHKNFIKRKNMEGGTVTDCNYQKERLKLQKLYVLLSNIKTDYENKIISFLVKTKPEYICIEDLNIRGMLKNRHLSKCISESRFYLFKQKLINKSKQVGIQIRIVDRFFPSSKSCCSCGNIKHDLKLSDRVYHCNKCGHTMDRDLNASLNLKNSAKYKLA